MLQDSQLRETYSMLRRYLKTMTETTSPLSKLIERRRFIQTAAAGTAISALGGGLWTLCDSQSALAQAASTLADGRPRLPPGQRVIERLKPMGGQQGDPSPRAFRLRLHGEVERPAVLDFAQLRSLPKTKKRLDVHCVTGWSAFDVEVVGVNLLELAKKVGVKSSAKHVIFEAAHGYTANVPLDEALRPDVVVTWRLDGRPLARAHGSPVRLINPHLYFWKSPKWLTGIRFQSTDEPGYWEVRGYNNHADPWREERYA